MHRFIVRGKQVIGARKAQEDAVSAINLGSEDDPLEEMIVVADGAGAHTGGRIASTHAVTGFTRCYLDDNPQRPIRLRLVDALHKANEAIAEQAEVAPSLKGMGSTLIGAVFSRTTVHWVSVGDSHLYRMRDGKITKLNADHSFGGYIDQMRATGSFIDPRETMPRNTLLSALTGDRVPIIDCPDVGLTLKSGDRFLICSDGVNTLPLQMIRMLSERADNPSRLVELVLGAIAFKDMPRQDNATLVVVDVVSADAPVAAEVEDDNDPLAIIGQVKKDP